MNKYMYYSNENVDIEFLKKYEIKNIPDSLLELIESGEWKLTFQEKKWIENNPERVLEYLLFRYDFYNTRDNIVEKEYPNYIVVELTSICNLRCSMCFQQDPILSEKEYRGYMQVDLFRKIVDESVQNGCKAITLAGRGEPLLNPKFAEILDYSANKFLELKINTNGVCLTEDKCHSILKNNVSLLVFSAEGTNSEEYLQTRCGGNFEKLLSNINMFNHIKEKYYPNAKTQTRVSGVLTGNVNKKTYYDFWEKYVDEVVLVTLENRKDSYRNEVSSKNCEVCHKLWNTMYIWWDGGITACDVDYLNKLNFGNMSNNTIKEIWNGKRINSIRAIHLNGERDRCTPCNRCEV